MERQILRKLLKEHSYQIFTKFGRNAHKNTTKQQNNFLMRRAPESDIANISPDRERQLIQQWL